MLALQILDTLFVIYKCPLRTFCMFYHVLNYQRWFVHFPPSSAIFRVIFWILLPLKILFLHIKYRFKCRLMVSVSQSVGLSHVNSENFGDTETSENLEILVKTLDEVTRPKPTARVFDDFVNICGVCQYRNEIRCP